MPCLIPGFQVTSVWQAFVLNSLASTFVIFIAIAVKERYDSYRDKSNQEITRSTDTKSVTLTMLATFFASMVAYTLLWTVFGYNAGIMVGAE